MAIFRNAKERIRSNNRIKELLEKVQLSSEAAGIGYWTFDEKTQAFWCDEKCASLWGGRPEDFPTGDSVRSRIVEEDVEPRRRSALESVKLRGRYESEFRVRHPDGSIHWVADMGRLIHPEDPSDLTWSGVIFDISARKENEAKAKEAIAREMELLEQAPEGIFLANIEGIYIDVNSAGCRMLGSTREEIIGKRILDLIPAEEAERLAEAKTELLSGKTQTAEWRLRCKDGTYLPVEVTAKIFPDGRWQGFVRDITERKEFEKKQTDLIRTLQASFKEIKVLRGLLPICSHCKNIRNDEGFWQQVEVYIRDHSEAIFSHGICPDCLKTYYPEFADLAE